MASVSTHVLDGGAGGPRIGVTVTLETPDGEAVGTGVTDDVGRVATLAADLAPGPYRLRWALSDTTGLLREVAVLVSLDEDRHYHLPLLASGASAMSYLGV